jgi:hypothetical protein
MVVLLVGEVFDRLPEARQQLGDPTEGEAQADEQRGERHEAPSKALARGGPRASPLSSDRRASGPTVAAGLSAAQPLAQARLVRKQNANCGHDNDGDECNRPHRLVPASPDWDHERQDDSAEDEPVDDAVQGEILSHGKSLVLSNELKRSAPTRSGRDCASPPTAARPRRPPACA